MGGPSATASWCSCAASASAPYRRKKTAWVLTVHEPRFCVMMLLDLGRPNCRQLVAAEQT